MLNKNRTVLGLNGDMQICKIHSLVQKIPEVKIQGKFPISDVILSGLAVFSLKSPSLLAFDTQMKANPNMKNLFHINKVPSDTALREILDKLDPHYLRVMYTELFAELQRKKYLQSYQYLGGHYLLSGDGTGYFSSSKIHCNNCMEKKYKKTGKIEYYHQFYGASIVHPDMKEVIPLCPEEIKKQDGDNKNDCERNASKRFLAHFRREHPKLKVIMIEDALASNFPHIQELEKHNISYILGAKKGDHKSLFETAYSSEAVEENHEYTQNYITKGGVKKQTLHSFRFVNSLSLNKTHPDCKVNFLEYWEEKENGKKQYFSWITNLEITKENIYEIMRGGRARWKIENETFNTLKNQGYNFEHNFGHGYENLSTVLALLMVLAFLVDQIEQMTSSLFQVALSVLKTKIGLWGRIRSLFDSMIFESRTQILEFIAYGYEKPVAKNLTMGSG